MVAFDGRTSGRRTTTTGAIQAAEEATATAHHLATVMIAQGGITTEATTIEATDERKGETIVAEMTGRGPHERRTQTNPRMTTRRSHARKRRKRKPLHPQLHLKR